MSCHQQGPARHLPAPRAHHPQLLPTRDKNDGWGYSPSSSLCCPWGELNGFPVHGSVSHVGAGQTWPRVDLVWQRGSLPLIPYALFSVGHECF